MTNPIPQQWSGLDDPALLTRVRALRSLGRNWAAISREVGISVYRLSTIRTELEMPSTVKIPVQRISEEGETTSPTTETETLLAFTPRGSVVPKGFEPGIEIGPEGGEIRTGELTEPVSDWTFVFERFQLDPSAFEIVDDTVKMSSWPLDVRDEEGQPIEPPAYRYAYKARFRKRVQMLLSSSVVESWREELQAAKANFKLKALPEGQVAYVMMVADPQLGKTGTQEAVANWKRGVIGHLNRAVALRKAGHNIAKIIVVFMGDEHEGVANNYANQAYLIELNLSQQLELDYDLRVWTIREALALGLPVEVVSVISNHGEFTRNGGKDTVTTKSDNSSTMIARLVKRQFDASPFASRITWHIAEDEPDVILSIFGVKTYFSHGHVAKGRGASTELRAKAAVERQILGRTTGLHDLTLIITAHYHHAYMLESENRSYFGCPALEAEKSSEYMLQQFGVWSRPGMLGMLVGTALGARGWAEAAIC